MKIMFIVQGEGRGHMTQALALEQILANAGHEVSSIVIGTSSRRAIPDFFKQQTKAILKPVESPNFYYDRNSKSINVWKTLLFNLFRIPLYLRELSKIEQARKNSQPDVIINFYDVLGGLYFLFFKPNTRRLCIAHQYLANHEEFPFAKGSKTQKLAFKLNNRITSFNTHKQLALSFRDLKSTDRKLSVVPPLLRREVLSLTPSKQDYILTYVVNKGYGVEIIKWHAKNKKIKLHCFWDNHDYPDEWSPNPNLTFHHINDQKFLELMAGCLGYASTAGFESICEAMYLDKPVLMVPVKGQYEQACNAEDAIMANAGIKARKFNIGLLLNYITKKHQATTDFNDWLTGYEHIFVKEIEQFEQESIDIKDRLRAFNPIPSFSEK